MLYMYGPYRKCLEHYLEKWQIISISGLIVLMVKALHSHTYLSVYVNPKMYDGEYLLRIFTKTQQK